MKLRYTHGYILMVVLGVMVAGSAVAGEWEVKEGSRWCDNGRRDGDRYCEVREITIKAGRDVVRVDGAANGGISVEGWSVSYRIMVPKQSNLGLETNNGGISVTDVEGEIEAEALNGGMKLTRLAGDVKAHTTNGGLDVELAGERWKGDGLDATTTNGGVRLRRG